MKTQFHFNPKGPFNLSLTINSGQTSQPPWKEDNHHFQELLIVDGAPCLVKIGHEDSDPENRVNIMAESPETVSEKAIKTKVQDIFGLEHDMDQLYTFLGEDPKMKTTIAFSQGLRIVKDLNPFE